MRYLGPQTAPRRDQDLLKSGPKHLPRRIRQHKTVKNLKNLETDFQKSMGYPSGPRFWSLHGCIWDHFGEDFGALLHLEFVPSLPRCRTIFVHFFQYFGGAFAWIRASTVAGSPLCGALDPPRQALCLRMAYRVPYPNPPPLCGTAC